MIRRIYSYFNYTLSYPEECFDGDGTDLSNIVFYVGKGTHLSRIDNHFREAAARRCSCEKCNVIRWIWSKGKAPLRKIVFETLSEDEAFGNEQHLIQSEYKSKYLTNVNHATPCGNRTYRRPVIEKDGEVYVSIAEASRFLKVSRPAFYKHYKGSLQEYHFERSSSPFFSLSELKSFAKPVEEEYLTAVDASLYLNVSRPTFYRRYRYVLEEVRIGKLQKVYYRRSDLDRIFKRM